MKLQLEKMAKSGLVLLMFVCMGSATASAQYLEDFTTNQTPLFFFGAYDATNAVFTSEGLDVDIPASADSFGGIGVAPPPGVSVDLTGVTAIEVTARLDAGNASDLVVSIREDDGMGGDGEFFSFTVAQTDFTLGEFVTVSIDPTTGFNGDTTDGVLNGPLNNTSIQSPFAGVDAQNFTVQSVNFVGATAVPEPGSCALLAALLPMIAFRRRKS